MKHLFVIEFSQNPPTYQATCRREKLSQRWRRSESSSFSIEVRKENHMEVQIKQKCDVKRVEQSVGEI